MRAAVLAALLLALVVAPAADAHADVSYLAQDCSEPTVGQTVDCVGGTYGGGTVRLLLHLCEHAFGSC